MSHDPFKLHFSGHPHRLGQKAAEQLLPLVYDELRKLAAARFLRLPVSCLWSDMNGVKINLTDRGIAVRSLQRLDHPPARNPTAQVAEVDTTEDVLCNLLRARGTGHLMQSAQVRRDENSPNVACRCRSCGYPEEKPRRKNGRYCYFGKWPRKC